VDSIGFLTRVFEEQDSAVEARLIRCAYRRDQHRQAAADNLALCAPRMHRLARLELEVVEFAAEQVLHVLERARAQASREIHRDHRPVKRYHPGEIHQRVEDKVASEKPTKILGVRAIALKSSSGSS